MSGEKLFKSAGPFQDDLLALLVADIDEAAPYYSTSFGMSEVGRAEPNDQRQTIQLCANSIATTSATSTMSP